MPPLYNRQCFRSEKNGWEEWRIPFSAPFLGQNGAVNGA
jgi:hypothetical protein